MHVVKCETSTAQPIFINLALVTTMTRSGNFTRIKFAAPSDQEVVVVETPEAIYLLPRVG